MRTEKKAVALKYDPEADEAPIVLAKGKGKTADDILEVARKYEIAVVENRAQLEFLMKVEIYQEIPSELYEFAAIVFAKLIDMDKRYVI